MSFDHDGAGCQAGEEEAVQRSGAGAQVQEQDCCGGGAGAAGAPGQAAAAGMLAGAIPHTAEKHLCWGCRLRMRLWQGC